MGDEAAKCIKTLGVKFDSKNKLSKTVSFYQRNFFDNA